ncbi:MAG TPA: hypothetical protein VHI30_06335 [Gaiellales bacterium]|nr:hypothetical protein [Gaiellales bacterium]
MATGVSQHHPRGKFRLAYVLLALAAGAAVVTLVILLDRSPRSTATTAATDVAWGNFQPAGLTQDRIDQIALHVGSTYRTTGNHQLVAVSASIPPAYQNNLPITQYVLSYEQNGRTSYQAVPIGANNVLYEMCGLGPQCAIDHGKASTDRGRLLRREALELALYTFHYTDVGSVVTFLPPKKGERPQFVFLFLRTAFEQQGLLAKPLSAILSEPTPPPAAAIPAAEAATIDGITEPDLYRFRYTSDQQGGVLLVFDPPALQ